MDDQDPLHPLGIWSADHFSTDNYYWRVTEGTGAFGPGGIWTISQKKKYKYVLFENILFYGLGASYVNDF